MALSLNALGGATGRRGCWFVDFGLLAVRIVTWTGEPDCQLC
ncbi:hypothetical protein [Acetobacter sp.]|nr:hypothetical protein [Acetobacter sp.]